MKKNKLAIGILIFLIVGSTAFSQTTDTNQQVGAPDPNAIGVDSAQQMLKEISVSKFEDAGFWNVSISRDQGLITARRFMGGPAEKKPIPGEAEAEIKEQDQFVLGLKVEYFGRGFKSIALMPVRPLPIEGICKTLSLWVVGRNFNHNLIIMIEDQFGNRADISMGKLNFSGWKKLTAAIPAYIKQRDYHFANKMGIKIVGFRVETDPAESYGTYYVYFDDLRAVTDLFEEEVRDKDDMPDTW
ncbi:MAG: flagellar filament outer layer protein FlaA [Spirochaetota bacterium]